MNFKQLIAKYVSGNLTSDHLPSVGVKGLEEGLNSPSLYILAGLEKNENSSEIDYYFTQTLLELNIELPDKRKAALEYAVGIVEEILAGNKNLFEGTREIVSQAIESYDFYSESEKYCYDSIGFAKAYGLYDTYDDLSNATVQWQEGKTNSQLLIEVKEELMDELTQWKPIINSA